MRLSTLLLLAACTPPVATEPSVPETTRTACDETRRLEDSASDHAAWFAELSAGVPERPVTQGLGEDTNGVLQLGLHGSPLPLLASSHGVHVAATTLGQGRIVAFSGQDFLSSGDRSTLLDDPGVASLLRNAVAWVAADHSGPLALRVANDAIGAILTEGTEHEAVIAPIVEQAGLRAIRDWSAPSLADQDVLVVQINEWGTLMLGDADLPAIRTFVEQGGGLLVAGSALHWAWWLSDQGPAFPGDALLEGAGIRWSRTSVRDMTVATLAERSTPEQLWCTYVRNETVARDRLTEIAPLFADAARSGRHVEVERGLKRLIEETPNLPANPENGRAGLAATVGAELVGVRWPAPHPWSTTFPGAVPASASRTDITVTIDTSWKRTHPLEAYAAPGDVVTVEVPDDHVGLGLRVRVGNLHDDLRRMSTVSEWRRAPALVQEVPLNASTVALGSGLGGPLSLVVPDSFADGTLALTLSGAVPMAVYEHGITSPDAFRAALDGGAPQAILRNRGRVKLVVGRDAAEQADVSSVMEFWSSFHAHHADLAQEPVPRRFDSDWLFDPQVGFGYANASPARINFPLVSEPWALAPDPDSDQDFWLFGHELGHQFQTADWTGGDVTEVCVNLWTMYTLNLMIERGDEVGTIESRFGPVDHAALRGMRWSEADFFGKLQLYRQLVSTFGWPVVQEVMASYYDPAYPRETHGSFMDGFALRFSAIVGRDITPFLDAWEYPLSNEARAQVQTWGLPDWMPPGWS